MTAPDKPTKERCNCGGMIIFDDERGIARCPDCKSFESYTTPALREKAKTARAGKTTASDEARDRLKLLEDAYDDAISALRYIRLTHGDLYGVGWARLDETYARVRGDV